MESSDPFRVALLATCSVVVAVRAYLNPGSGLWSLLQGKVNFKASFWQARAPSPTPESAGTQQQEPVWRDFRARGDETQFSGDLYDPSVAPP
uniref:Putative secreted protein n=1 Tax=Anopheles darlingi TaxID=43151 RepID=A0A2M4D881_ANODA